jgi:hypothetical protein
MGIMDKEVKIKPTETVIDSTYNHWWFGTNHLTPEEGKKVAHRINLLTKDYLTKIFSVNWEILYQDPEDYRYWELTYPHGEYHGGGPPLLRYLTDEEAVMKYKISPRYIPELKPKPEETIMDSYGLTENLSLVEADKIYFRIGWLLQYYLKKIIVVNEENVLYQDPEDRRYWELTYPRGYLHGSGSKLLRYLTDEEAEAKYHIKR